jgi:hypothetical protein
MKKLLLAGLLGVAGAFGGAEAASAGEARL